MMETTWQWFSKFERLGVAIIIIGFMATWTFVGIDVYGSLGDYLKERSFTWSLPIFALTIFVYTYKTIQSLKEAKRQGRIL